MRPCRCWKALTSYASRVRVLQADCYELQPEIVDALFTFKFLLTNLEHCALTSGSIRIQHHPGGDGSSVRELRQPPISVPYGAPFPSFEQLPGLAHLEITDPLWRGDPNVFVHSMLTLLSRTPALRTLHVDLPSRTGAADSKWGSRPVQLNVLDTLSVESEDRHSKTAGHGTFRRELLSHIDVPRIRVASLGAYHALALLPSVASARVCHGKKASHLRIEVTCLLSLHAMMTMIALNPVRSEKTQLEAREQWMASKDRIEEEMARCLRDMFANYHPFSTLTHLWIEHRFSKWILLCHKGPLISSLPQLESLGLVIWDTEELRIGRLLADLEVSTSGHVSCPLLRSLLVE
ncbi:hypothetical protein C8T65DRAFT_55305 [Cerioporus squamosus]|nr:hypothetical protein C8T65DRAFT_55305 [Cerioporus squamosus]